MKRTSLLLAGLLLLVSACAALGPRPVDSLPSPSGWTENEARISLPDGLYQSSRTFHDHRASLLVLAIAPMDKDSEGIDVDALLGVYEAARPDRIKLITDALEKAGKSKNLETMTYLLAAA